MNVTYSPEESDPISHATCADLNQYVFCFSISYLALTVSYYPLAKKLRKKGVYPIS